jgi:hypothetical protein
MGVYRPRNPRASALWQCARRHGTELRESGRLRRAVEERTLERFLECGDPHHGFARIYCDACGHDWLLAFSCKTRYFCPSCHQKRVLHCGEWVEEQVLAPVAHRQYVFTIPRLLRPMFGVHRAWLGELCRIAARLLVEAYAEAAPGARPGLILFVQTFGDLANFNPHVHVLAADGGFGADGTFIALPPVPEGLLAEGFRRAVLEFLVKARAIRDELRSRLLGWRHFGGFSVHNQVRVGEGDAEGRKKARRLHAARSHGTGEDALRRAHGHGDLPLEDARGAEEELPDDAGRGVAGATLQAHPRPLRASGALCRLVLEPRAR